MINIKRTKRYKTRQQYFPGSSIEFPVPFDRYAYRIEDKEQEYSTVYRS